MFSPQSVTLDILKQPVAHELDRFDTIFRDYLHSTTPLVDLVTRYLIRNKGKRVRPLLVLLSAQISGGTINDRSYHAAALIEMLHTATLIHDDIVDNADTRRGVLSLNGIWKNKIAVLMGDYLLAKGLLVSLQEKEYEPLHIISEAVKRMSEGELLQIQKSRQLNIDEETYFRIISDKTASFFAACTEIGSMTTSDDPVVHEKLYGYGMHIGIAFQIRDDILDYTGRRTILGKPIAADLKEKKLTLPIIYALTKSDRSSAKRAISMIKKGVGTDDVAWLFEFVKTNGGIDYAEQKAQEHIAQAKACLLQFPDSPVKKSLENFSEFVLQREK
jgi:octaprenyl-diphosphate synthase